MHSSGEFDGPTIEIGIEDAGQLNAIIRFLNFHDCEVVLAVEHLINAPLFEVFQSGYFGFDHEIQDVRGVPIIFVKGAGGASRHREARGSRTFLKRFAFREF